MEVRRNKVREVPPSPPGLSAVLVCKQLPWV